MPGANAALQAPEQPTGVTTAGSYCTVTSQLPTRAREDASDNVHGALLSSWNRDVLRNDADVHVAVGG